MKTSDLLMLSILALFLTSCRSISRQESKSSEAKTEIFSEKKTTYKDTIFHTEKAISRLKMPISSLFENDFNAQLNTIEKGIKTTEKAKVFTQKNGNATAKLRVEKDSIFVEAECDSLALRAKIRQDFEHYYQNYKSEKILAKTEKPRTFMHDIIYWIFFFMAGVGIGFFTRITIKNK